MSRKDSLRNRAWAVAYAYERVKADEGLPLPSGNERHAIGFDEGYRAAMRDLRKVVSNERKATRRLTLADSGMHLLSRVLVWLRPLR